MKAPAFQPLTGHGCSNVLRIPRRGGPEGSGLGLAIVRALADRLGADVRLHDGKNGTGLLAVVHFRGAIAKAGPRADTRAHWNDHAGGLSSAV